MLNIMYVYLWIFIKVTRSQKKLSFLNISLLDFITKIFVAPMGNISLLNFIAKILPAL